MDPIYRLARKQGEKESQEPDLWVAFENVMLHGCGVVGFITNTGGLFVHLTVVTPPKLTLHQSHSGKHTCTVWVESK